MELQPLINSEARWLHQLLPMRLPTHSEAPLPNRKATLLGLQLQQLFLRGKTSLLHLVLDLLRLWRIILLLQRSQSQLLPQDHLLLQCQHLDLRKRLLQILETQP